MPAKSRSRRPRGRHSLLAAVVVYVLAQVAVCAVINGCLPELRSPFLVDIFAQLRRCSPGQPDVVCLGTSRCSGAFSTDEVQYQMRKLTEDNRLEVFNASLSSQDLITADFILAGMLQCGARPSLAVVEVAPELVARNDLHFGMHVLPRPTWANLPAYAGALRRAYSNLPGILSDLAYPLYRCRREIWTAIDDGLRREWGLTLTAEPLDVWGRRASAAYAAQADGLQGLRASTYLASLDADQARTREEGVKQGLRTMRRWLANYEVGGLTATALERLLERCGQHAIRVVLVVPPVGSEQRRLYTPEIESPFQEYVQRLQQTYGCQYIDCRDYLPDACFVDNHHVRPVLGSIPFSNRLAREVLTPAYRARHSAPDRVAELFPVAFHRSAGSK